LGFFAIIPFKGSIYKKPSKDYKIEIKRAFNIILLSSRPGEVVVAGTTHTVIQTRLFLRVGLYLFSDV